MIRKVEKELSAYEKFFMTEAPARKPYMKIVSAFPDGRLKSFDNNIEGLDDEEDTPVNDDDLELVDDTDFSQNIDMSDDEGEEVSVDAEEVTDTSTGTTDVEVAADVEPAPAEASVEQPEPAGEPAADDTGLQTEPPAGDDVPVDDGGEETEGDAPEGGDVEGGGLDTSDGGDFDDNIEGGAEDESMEPEADAGGGEEGESVAPKNNMENQLKFSLYKNMKNLYVAVQNYEEKLDNLSVTSYNYNMVIKAASSKLADLEDVMYQYMTIRFKDEDYIVSMEFYQKCIASILLVFEMLRNNKENPNSKDKTIK